MRDQIFQEMVADYRQLLTVLDEQFTCMGGPDEIAVKDISAALAELEEDLRAALDVADHSRKKSSPSTDVTPQQ
ncbi:hypothetical protein KL867_05860 [Ruegeria litorea]|nr:hypothetical protein [Falsiruegeria litorea]MBT3140565.1 hypothetical protein [Falsiruegeria litorea]